MKFFLLLLLLAQLALAQDQTVFKTVEDGVVSFSDTPPESGEVEVLTLEVPEAPADGLLEERLTEMRETTDRMVADRQAREKHRAELRAAARVNDEPEQVVVAQPVSPWVGGFWPGYSRPGYGRPGHRPRPPYRPRPTPLPTPNTPGWSVMQPGNSQLMRPIVSSRP